ncbi:hypothetical protein BGX28_001861 [Mortierella sp. GBA30]|nr:hypothetical protein BGX28_001861 [Mortierella sp. GBA30]
MILQAAYLFQIRPRRGYRNSEDQPQTTAVPPKAQQQYRTTYDQSLATKDLYTQYKDGQLQDILTRLTRLLLHPEFQPRLMRSSYSFRNKESSYGHHHHSERRDRTQHGHQSGESSKKSKRTRRDLQDYPIFLTGNPPDLVRLAIEFGHIPFVDHLLHRGFRPRDLPEYFSMIPWLPVGPDKSNIRDQGNIPDEDLEGTTLKANEAAGEQAAAEHQDLPKSYLKRSHELSRIWECMRIANQELMDACSRADLTAVLKVIDATLVRPRPALEGSARSNIYPSTGHMLRTKADQKGKHRQLNQDDPESSQGQTDMESTLSDQQLVGVDMADIQVGSSSHHSRNLAVAVEGVGSPEDNIHPPSLSLAPQPAVIHWSTTFRTRPRVDSGGSHANIRPLIAESFKISHLERQESQTHMPWIDGRALTSALLAVCFRRDGFESEEAAALEESKAVPIVSELLKYDCMLTAQSLGQAVLGVAYSRPSGSLKNAHERRLQQQHQTQRHRVAGTPTVSVMDLLMERIGPREWLKLIKCYLQRQEFEDLAVILERCPFKGPQIEAAEKARNTDFRQPNRSGSCDALNQQESYRRQVRELIVREAGICGVGTRLGHFTGRGIGQASYNVSSTLHTASRILFTGSGTRFNQSYMLPRGGFRGISGNNSGHSSLVGGEQTVDTAESFHDADDDAQIDTPPAEMNYPSEPTQQQSSTHHGNKDDGPEVAVDHNGEDGFESAEHIDAQDTNLAFGGVGTSTTSSSRPGPGIVGIAIQVKAPEHILKALLNMGFRFFSISDLSIPDIGHPLALQFRQQEKMNRQLVEFCMVPSMESRGSEVGVNKCKGKQKKAPRRGECRYDAADDDYHAMVVERFLYPAASNPARGAVSISGLPSLIYGYSGNGSRCNQSHGPIAMTRQRSSLINSPANPPSPTSVATSKLSEHAAIPTTSTASSSLPPSNVFQFVLPPIQLGDSIEEIAAAAASRISDDEDIRSTWPPSSLSLAQIERSRLAKSMPLPIRTSMTETRPSSADGRCSLSCQPSPELSPQQQMIQETIRRRVRECLSSEYIDLVTVGICLYQACYHRKELLLIVLLEHRLLVAQDALTGAVQVAASVGWKRGLELLLMQKGDMEAEIEPVVTTTSEHIHQGTSTKWDHATAVQLYPGQGGQRSSSAGILSTESRARASTAGGIEGFVSRGLRRRRSDGDQLNRISGSSGNGSGSTGYDDRIEAGVGVGEGFDYNRRSSFDFWEIPPSSADHGDSTPSYALRSLYSTPVAPTPRSSSLKTKLLYLLPNLSTTFSNSSSGGLADAQKGPRAGHEREHEENYQDREKPEEDPQYATHPSTSAPPVLMLSTSGLWSLPSVMMQRKSRNAVVALMAAVTRNDPGLVHWLIETFADIKVAHILQALMTACDLGLVRVVQELMGSSLITDQQGVGAEGTKDSNGSRRLFRSWLAFQYKKILDLTIVLPAGSESARATTEDATQEFNSFPFIFLMESSPLFRHFYMTLNTLSSCRFMTKGRDLSRNSYSADPSSSQARNSTKSSTENMGSTPRRYSTDPLLSHRHKSINAQRQNGRSRAPQDTKLEIIRIMLAPVLELLGPISVRKALDRLPRDCWWPLDHDVRLVVDQEARKSMVAIIMSKKQQELRKRVHVGEQQPQKAYERKRLRHAQQSGLLGHLQQHCRRGHGSAQRQGQGQRQVQRETGGQEVVLDENEKEDMNGSAVEQHGKQTLHKAAGHWRKVRRWMMHRRQRRRSPANEDLDAEKRMSLDHRTTTRDMGPEPSFFRGMSLGNIVM